MLARGVIQAAAVCLMLTGCATAPPASAPTADAQGIVTFDVGGAKVRFQPVEGWCLFPSDRLNDVKRHFDDELTVHAAYGDCAELKASEGTDEGIINQGFICTPDSLLTTDLGDDRAGFLRAMVDELQDLDLSRDFVDEQSALKERLKDKIAEANAKGIHVDILDPDNLGLMAQDDRGAYIGVLQRVKISDNSQTSWAGVISLFGVTEIEGRVLIFYMGAYYDGKDSVDEALALAKAQTEKLIELNPDLGLPI